MAPVGFVVFSSHGNSLNPLKIDDEAQQIKSQAWQSALEKQTLFLPRLQALPVAP